MMRKQLITTILSLGIATVITACTDGSNTGGATSNGTNQSLTLQKSGLTGSTCDGIGTWNANTVYSTAGTLVVYDGKEYKNNWWTQGSNPEQNSGAQGSGQPWTFVEDCGIAPTPSPTVEPTIEPTVEPTETPTVEPTIEPTVTPTVPPSKIVTYPTDRGSYTGGTIVYGTDGKAYQCLSDIVAPWCNSTAEWAYAPGTGSAWSSAWELVVSPVIPTQEPTITPTIAPTIEPTIAPTEEPTVEPTEEPTVTPTIAPTEEPTIEPTVTPTTSPSGKQLSIFWCGFGGDYCGQSTTDDVNPKATMVILAFANSNPDGSISVDDANWPTTLINNWQKAGKKVLISVGGQNGHWDSIFANPQNFVSSVNNVIKKYNIDGIDLDIEGYTTAPQAVSLTINTLRNQIGKNKLIVISPEVVGVYQGAAIPAANVGGNAWNYFVPVLNASINQIDYVQPQEYNNWYDTSTMSSQYLMNGYLQWVNKDGLYGTKAFSPSQYVGVPPEKLIMGVLASTSAGGAAFYPTPQMLTSAISTLNSTYNTNVGGVMMWDSHWDTLNNCTISNAAVQALGL